MVNIGIVGIGFMGMTHYKAMAQVRGGQVAAIVSRDPKKRAGDWNDIQGNFGDSGGVQDLSGIRCYETLDELLADGEIDLVDICLPTNMHVETSIRTLSAGKHVLLEKPIALALDAADRIVGGGRGTPAAVYGCPCAAVFPGISADQTTRRRRGTWPCARRSFQTHHLAPGVVGTRRSGAHRWTSNRPAHPRR